MRWRSLDEPWGDHQSAASAVKWETSSGLTEEKEDEEDEEVEEEDSELCHRS